MLCGEICGGRGKEGFSASTRKLERISGRFEIPSLGRAHLPLINEGVWDEKRR